MRHLFHWIETHWVTPDYKGWVLSGLVIFFFGAATNTMAGWLYVISGVMLALLVVGATLPSRTLRQLSVERYPLAPVMVGEAMTVRVTLLNDSPITKDLLQIRDTLPTTFQQEAIAPVESLKPHESYIWTYQCQPPGRGIYHWHTVQLHTAAPLGLFWCRRDRPAPARAVVYPTILSFDQCSLLDVLGRETHAPTLSPRQAAQSNEGLTRALRPYRWGDPTRLIHWRTSARYGELRVRELEVLTSSPSVVIAIDTALAWEPEHFEQAAIAAISLYTYACRQQMNVSLWTAEYGTAHTQQTVYEVLAAMKPQAGAMTASPPSPSMLWLTPSATRLDNLPADSRWLLWPSQLSDVPTKRLYYRSNGIVKGIVIQPDQELRSQLSG